MNQNHFKQDAKSIIDMLHDTKIFREGTTRDDMNILEGMVEFMLQSRFDSYIRGQKFLERVNNIKNTPHP